mgnify:CR=1 FL=1
MEGGAEPQGAVGVGNKIFVAFGAGMHYNEFGQLNRMSSGRGEIPTGGTVRDRAQQCAR